MTLSSQNMNENAWMTVITTIEKNRICKNFKTKSLRPNLIWSRYGSDLHRFEISTSNTSNPIASKFLNTWKKKNFKVNLYENPDDPLRWIHGDISSVSDLQKAVTEPFWKIFISNLKWKLPDHTRRQYQKVLDEIWIENFFNIHIDFTYFQKHPPFGPRFWYKI